MTHVVARIGKPHGVRGEVTVRLHTDEPRRRLVPGARFVLQRPVRDAPGAARPPDDAVTVPGGGPRTLTVSTAREHNSVWLLRFEGVADRDAAERLRGFQLLLEPDSLPAAAEPAGEADLDAGDDADDGDEDGWYEDELVGLAVEDVDGSPVGTVSGLRLGPAQDLLQVALAGGGTASVPFVTALVPVVDVAGGRVVVDPPPGLLELDT